MPDRGILRSGVKQATQETEVDYFSGSQTSFFKPKGENQCI